MYYREHMTVILGDHNIDPGKNLERYEVVRKFKLKSFTKVLKGDDIMLLKVKRWLVCGEFAQEQCNQTLKGKNEVRVKCICIYSSARKRFWEER